MKTNKETTSQNNEIVRNSGSKKVEAKLPASLEVDTKTMADLWTNKKKRHHFESLKRNLQEFQYYLKNGRAKEAKVNQATVWKEAGWVKVMEQNTKGIFHLFHEPMPFLWIRR